MSQLVIPFKPKPNTNDPALLKKKDLTELGENIVNDLGKTVKSLVKNSNLHENMSIISKSFAAHEGNISQTDEMIKQMQQLSQELMNQVKFLQNSLQQIEPLNQKVNEITTSIHTSVPSSQPHL
ncbi:hypothetical protein RB653_003718 [Dictyostelium firmibasis]|uniref:BLOC-1-related complex subunit 7 n=1 Tax=Dictyostelium firmibasis TaxID=79012 RepID=A0AAN7U9G0_9MYCE